MLQIKTLSSPMLSAFTSVSLVATWGAFHSEFSLSASLVSIPIVMTSFLISNLVVEGFHRLVDEQYKTRNLINNIFKPLIAGFLCSASIIFFEDLASKKVLFSLSKEFALTALQLPSLSVFIIVYGLLSMAYILRRYQRRSLQGI